MAEKRKREPKDDEQANLTAVDEVVEDNHIVFTRLLRYTNEREDAVSAMLDMY
jgi:hypothetical protein